MTSDKTFGRRVLERAKKRDLARNPFDLFLTYLKDPSGLSPEQTHAVQTLLEPASVSIAHFKKNAGNEVNALLARIKEVIDPTWCIRVMESGIFSNGELKASVKEAAGGWKTTPVNSLECFVTNLAADLQFWGEFPSKEGYQKWFLKAWKAGLWERLAKWHLDFLDLKEVLARYGLIHASTLKKWERTICGFCQEAADAARSSPGKINSIRDKIGKGDVVEMLILRFLHHAPTLKQMPMAKRITELLAAFPELPKKYNYPAILQRIKRYPLP